MSDLQRIIVYRNPVEAAFWEGGMLWPILCGGFVAFVVVCILGLLMEKFVRTRRDTTWVYLVAIVAAFAGTFKFMGVV